MSKSIKLDNDTYLDSTNVIYNKKTLDKIIFGDIHTATRTSNLTTDGTVYWYQIGRLVFVLFQDIVTAVDLTNWTNAILTSLPRAFSWGLGGLYTDMSKIIGCQMSGTNLNLTTRTHGTIPKGTKLNGYYIYLSTEIV